MDRFLQVSPFDSDGGEMIGRNPRDIPPEDWRGQSLLVGLKAIRAKCLDCAFTASEVRKCVQSDCPLWPLRMGTVPKGFNIARQEPISPTSLEGKVVVPASVDSEEKPACEAENDEEGAE